LLTVPVDELIGQVSRNQAIEFVLSVSLDYPDSAAGIGELAQLESAMNTAQEPQLNRPTSLPDEQSKSTEAMSSNAVTRGSETAAEPKLINAETETSTQPVQKI
jgi:hypothetical protein